MAAAPSSISDGPEDFPARERASSPPPRRRLKEVAMTNEMAKQPSPQPEEAAAPISMAAIVIKKTPGTQLAASADITHAADDADDSLLAILAYDTVR